MFTWQFATCASSGSLDSLLSLAENAQTDSARVNYYVNLSKGYLNVDALRSVKFAEKAVDIAKNAELEYLEAYAGYNMGNAYFRNGLLEQAAGAYFQYLETSLELGDLKGQAYAHSNLGAVYLRLKEYHKAQTYFEQAVEVFKSLSEQSGKPSVETISICNNLGVIARNLDHPDSAIVHYENGLESAALFPQAIVQRGNLLNNLGTVYLDIDDFQKARLYFEEALALRIDNSDKLGIVRSYLSLGQYHLALQNLDSALNYFSSAAALASTASAKSAEAEALELVYRVYDNLQQADSALKYHLRYYDIKQSLHEETAASELARLELRMRYEENTRLAEIDAERRENAYFLAGLTLALVALSLGLLYFLARNRSRRLKAEKDNAFLRAISLELEQKQTAHTLELRNKELTTQVMYELKKDSMLEDIVSKLRHMSSKEGGATPTSVDEIVDEINKTRKSEVWDEFELRFQQVDNDFHTRLNRLHPDLTTNERRLSAFLKLSMTTKEISSITGQSNRSIEVARTRLRKKLKLTHSDQGLVDYIASI